MSARAAVIQMNSSDDPAANLLRAATLVSRAAEAGAELVVLPEMFTCIGSRAAMQNALQWPGHTAALENLQQLAARLRIWLVCGTLPWCDAAPAASKAPAANQAQQQNQKPFARCFVLNGNGEIVAHYDKMHLFDVQVADNQGAYRESDSYAAGSRTVLVDTPLGKLGLAVCYDLRFPELFRKLWQQGAEIFALPSAFTATTGAAHWEALLRARAIENCCYLLAPAQVGRHADGRSTWGHSAIVEPWGGIDYFTGAEGWLCGAIDLQRLASLRARMPCHAHQKILL